MTCSKPALGALALALLVPLASCGLPREVGGAADTGAGPPSATAEPAKASPEPGSAEDALPYFKALGRSSDPAVMEEGLTFAHPDRPAHGYLQHQANGYRANLVSDYPAQDAQVELRGETIEICWPSGCVTFGGFEFVEDLLADFRVEDNLVGDHFLPGGGSDSVEGITATVTSSYLAVEADCLIVFVDVETESAEVGFADATQEDPDGAIAHLDPYYGVVGHDHFTPGSPGQAMLRFESTNGGGTVDLVLECAGGCDGEVLLSLPLE